MKKKNSENEIIEAEELAAFGERLRDIREQLRLKQNMMAPDLGVSASSLSGLEKGKSKPSYDVIKRIYQNFNISINYLLDGYGEALVDREKLAVASIDESSPENEKLKELLFYLENAPIVKYAIFEFFSTYLFRNKEAIKDDMEKHKHFISRLKQNQDSGKK